MFQYYIMLSKNKIKITWINQTALKQKGKKDEASYTTPFPDSSHMPLRLVFNLKDKQAATEKNICHLLSDHY